MIITRILLLLLAFSLLSGCGTTSALLAQDMRTLVSAVTGKPNKPETPDKPIKTPVEPSVKTAMVAVDTPVTKKVATPVVVKQKEQPKKVVSKPRVITTCKKGKLTVFDRKLEKAIIENDRDKMNVALKQGADMYQALCKATTQPLDTEGLKLLVSHGWDPQYNCSLRRVFAPDLNVKFYNHSPAERERKVDYLIAEGADVHCRGRGDPLIHSIMHEMFDHFSEGEQGKATVNMLKAILEAGAKDDLNLFTELFIGKRYYPIWNVWKIELRNRQLLSSRYRAKYINLFLDYGLDPDSRGKKYKNGKLAGRTLLINALTLGDYDLAQRLIHMGADPNVNIGRSERDPWTAADIFLHDGNDRAEEFIVTNGGIYLRN